MGLQPTVCRVRLREEPRRPASGPGTVGCLWARLHSVQQHLPEQGGRECGEWSLLFLWPTFKQLC